MFWWLLLLTSPTLEMGLSIDGTGASRAPLLCLSVLGPHSEEDFAWKIEVLLSALILLASFISATVGTENAPFFCAVSAMWVGRGRGERRSKVNAESAIEDVIANGRERLASSFFKLCGV